MGTFLCMSVLFLAKLLDNALGTARTVFVQRNKPLLAGLALAVSNFIYFWITKKIVSADGNAALLIVSIAGGVGCWLAVIVSNRLSKDRTYVNVIMSDNKEAVQRLRDFLAEHHITNVATDSYTRDWNIKPSRLLPTPKRKRRAGSLTSISPGAAANSNEWCRTHRDDYSARCACALLFSMISAI